MYELFVLGELMTGTKHGYVLLDILKNSAGRIRPISSGTLYPLLSRLVESGLITLHEEEESAGGRVRKIYGITEAGRSRFRELMEKPLDINADTEHLFHYKMVYFRYVEKQVRLACMNQYLKYLQEMRNHAADIEARLLKWKPEPEKQRLQLLRMLDHRKHVGEADMAWIEKEIERIEREE